jgi:hypothetical protein
MTRTVGARITAAWLTVPVMTISERTRKIVWTTAGGPCSICRVQLVTDRTSTDDPSVFGEEAHIVVQSGGRPRAGNVADPDRYDNLALLCSKDHKRVDDQVGCYNVARLREIKRNHEPSWSPSASTRCTPGKRSGTSPPPT